MGIKPEPKPKPDDCKKLMDKLAALEKRVKALEDKH